MRQHRARLPKKGGEKRRYLLQAQDTESIEVWGQPLPAGRQAEPLHLGLD